MKALAYYDSLQFMAWERNFESRVLKIRKRELKNQHLVYIIEVKYISILSCYFVLTTLAQTIWSCMWYVLCGSDSRQKPELVFTGMVLLLSSPLSHSGILLSTAVKCLPHLSRSRRSMVDL